MSSPLHDEDPHAKLGAFVRTNLSIMLNSLEGRNSFLNSEFVKQMNNSFLFYKFFRQIQARLFSSSDEEKKRIFSEIKSYLESNELSEKKMDQIFDLLFVIAGEEVIEDETGGKIRSRGLKKQADQDLAKFLVNAILDQPRYMARYSALIEAGLADETPLHFAVAKRTAGAITVFCEGRSSEDRFKFLGAQCSYPKDWEWKSVLRMLTDYYASGSEGSIFILAVLELIELGVHLDQTQEYNLLSELNLIRFSNPNTWFALKILLENGADHRPLFLSLVTLNHNDFKRAVSNPAFLFLLEKEADLVLKNISSSNDFSNGALISLIETEVNNLDNKLSDDVSKINYQIIKSDISRIAVLLAQGESKLEFQKMRKEIISGKSPNFFKGYEQLMETKCAAQALSLAFPINSPQFFSVFRLWFWIEERKGCDQPLDFNEKTNNGETLLETCFKHCGSFSFLVILLLMENSSSEGQTIRLLEDVLLLNQKYLSEGKNLFGIKPGDAERHLSFLERKLRHLKAKQLVGLYMKEGFIPDEKSEALDEENKDLLRAEVKSLSREAFDLMTVIKKEKYKGRCMHLYTHIMKYWKNSSEPPPGERRPNPKRP